MKLRRFVQTALPIVLLISLVACGATATPAAQATSAPPTSVPPATLVIAEDTSDVIMLDPCQAYEETAMWTSAAAYQGLMDFKPGDVTKPVGGLAEKWEISTDGLTYTYYINANAKFSSGNPVTAEDVRFILD